MWDLYFYWWNFHWCLCHLFILLFYDNMTVSFLSISGEHNSWFSEPNITQMKGCFKWTIHKQIQKQGVASSNKHGSKRCVKGVDKWFENYCLELFIRGPNSSTLKIEREWVIECHVNDGCDYLSILKFNLIFFSKKGRLCWTLTYREPQTNRSNHTQSVI